MEVEVHTNYGLALAGIRLHDPPYMGVIPSIWGRDRNVYTTCPNAMTERSRDGKPHPIAMDNPNDATLTSRFHQFLQPQIPAAFKISPLPPSILSWVTQAL